MGDVSGICAKISFSVDLFLAGKLQNIESKLHKMTHEDIYDSLSDVGEIRVYQRADFQSGSRVLKKVF